MNRIAIFDDGLKSGAWGAELIRNQPSTNYYKDYYYGDDIEKELSLIDATDFGAKEYKAGHLPGFYMDFHIKTTKKRAKLYDVNEANGFLMMSKKALDILNAEDPILHQVLPVTIVNWEGKSPEESYFIVNILRYIEVKKDYSPFDFSSPKSEDAKAYIHGMINSDDIRSYLAHKYVWRKSCSPHTFYWAEDFINRMKAAGCTGLDEKTLKKDSRHGAPIRYV